MTFYVQSFWLKYCERNQGCVNGSQCVCMCVSSLQLKKYGLILIASHRWIQKYFWGPMFTNFEQYNSMTLWRLFSTCFYWALSWTPFSSNVWFHKRRQHNYFQIFSAFFSPPPKWRKALFFKQKKTLAWPAANEEFENK